MNKYVNSILVFIVAGAVAQFVSNVQSIEALSRSNLNREPSVVTIEADCDTDMECAQAHPEREF